MSARKRDLQIPEALAQEIARQSADRQATWSALATELLEEAVRMRRAPGVVFADGPAGRRATVAGTGLDVWEVVATWRACGEDFGRLRRSYEWLNEPQLRAALAYYQLYPQEIDARLKIEAGWTPERVASELAAARSRLG
jgi:uncharacterized protein (DUF433 family)